MHNADAPDSLACFVHGLRRSWFAPIELHTKRGLRGNIIEPLGTHGYMKCKFSDYLKQNDEVGYNVFANQRE